MKKLIVNIANAKIKMVDGKLKTFNTLSFDVEDDNEALSKLGELKDENIEVVKYNIIFK